MDIESVLHVEKLQAGGAMKNERNIAADEFFNNNCDVHSDDVDLAFKNYTAGYDKAIEHVLKAVGELPDPEVFWIGISDTNIAHINKKQAWSTDRAYVYKSEFDQIIKKIKGDKK
ncbi:MAG TPA: hypothetical protein VHA52_01055 [Candidatus Babeliaceae bacterium]|nr:hypothetical protein [Candidatus Babeliaceae bacterium]